MRERGVRLRRGPLLPIPHGEVSKRHPCLRLPWNSIHTCRGLYQTVKVLPLPGLPQSAKPLEFRGQENGKKPARYSAREQELEQSLLLLIRTSLMALSCSPPYLYPGVMSLIFLQMP
jgi:hypothetical protein